jgi:hypothetical protein
MNICNRLQAIENLAQLHPDRATLKAFLMRRTGVATLHSLHCPQPTSHEQRWAMTEGAIDEYLQSIAGH